MKWHQLTKGQQAAARRIVEKLWDAGVKQATTTSVARNLDDAMDWDAGWLTLEDLCRRTGWDAPAPDPEPEDEPGTQEITAKELAARLGVSITTAYRHCRAGLAQAVKNATGRWVITVEVA